MRVEVWVRQSDRSKEVVQPGVVVFDSQRGMIAGEFLLDNCSVERAAVCFVGEHDDTVAAGWTADDNVAGVVVGASLPSVYRWPDFKTPSGAPSEFVVNPPQGRPPQVVELEHVCEKPPIARRSTEERPVTVEPWFGFVETTLDHSKRNEHFVVDEPLDRCRGPSLEVPLKKHKALPGVSPLLSRGRIEVSGSPGVRQLGSPVVCVRT